MNQLFKVNMTRKQEHGFTLVEMMVVMSIISMLTLLMAAALISAGKQTRLQDAAKTLQSNIRKAANNAITVSPDLNNPDTPSKAWAIELTDGASSYKLVNFSGDGNSSDIIAIPNRSESPANTFSAGSGIYFDILTSELDLVFSSPFAKFKGVAGKIESREIWAEDPETKEITPRPTESGLTGSILIDVKDTEGNTITLEVDAGTGETSIIR